MLVIIRGYLAAVQVSYSPESELLDPSPCGTVERFLTATVTAPVVQQVMNRLGCKIMENEADG